MYPSLQAEVAKYKALPDMWHDLAKDVSSGRVAVNE
jgi:hypothetical protein